MQTAMEDKYPEVVNLKKMGEGLKKILGDESEASALVDEQIKDFMECWKNLADDIQEKIRKLESSERQLSTMYRYMDNTSDWMDDVKDLLDQYEANERRLQGLPDETRPKDSEDEPKVSEGETKESEPKEAEEEAKEGATEPRVSEEAAIVSDEKAGVSEAEPDVKELDEDEKERLRQQNKNLVEEFVVKRQSRATCQAFVDWVGELEQHVSEDLDDDSKNLLTIRIEKFNSNWDVFTNKIEDFSHKNAEVSFGLILK